MCMLQTSWMSDFALLFQVGSTVSSSSCLMCMECSSSRWTTTGWDTHTCTHPPRWAALSMHPPNDYIGGGLSQYRLYFWSWPERSCWLAPQEQTWGAVHHGIGLIWEGRNWRILEIWDWARTTSGDFSCPPYFRAWYRICSLAMDGDVKREHKHGQVRVLRNALEVNADVPSPPLPVPRCQYAHYSTPSTSASSPRHTLTTPACSPWWLGSSSSALSSSTWKRRRNPSRGGRTRGSPGGGFYSDRQIWVWSP